MENWTVSSFKLTLNVIAIRTESLLCWWTFWSTLRVYFSHIQNTEGEYLHRHIQNSNKSSALLRRVVERREAADRGRKWRLNSAAKITWLSWHTDTGVWRLFSPQTLLTSSSMTCITAFSPGDTFFLFSQIRFYWLSTDFILGGQEIETVEPLTRTFAFTHAPPPKKIRRNLSCFYV